jgi:hypothetical protein
MNKPQRPPSEHRANRAGRILAEMVLKSPPKNRPQTNTSGGGSPPHSTSHNPLVTAKGRIKEEETESKEVVSAVAPVAMSLVDFSYVLSLVFGGCCS